MTIKDIKGCLVILALALGLGFGVNAVSPQGIALFGQWDREAGTLMAGAMQEPAVRAEEINNPLKVRKMLASGGIFLIDVRRADLYAQGHIPGAESFPLYEFDAVIGRFRDRIKPQDPVLVYCSGVACVDSHTFAERLIQMGYTRVTVYSGGFSEWEEIGFDVETGS